MQTAALFAVCNRIGKAEVAYIPPQQTPMTRTFLLGWSAVAKSDLKAWRIKACRTIDRDLSSNSRGGSDLAYSLG